MTEEEGWLFATGAFAEEGRSAEGEALEDDLDSLVHRDVLASSVSLAFVSLSHLK